MIIAGAGGHAREILDLPDFKSGKNIFLYDDVNLQLNQLGLFPVLHNKEQLLNELKNNPEFILGTGSPALRRKMYEQFIALGGLASTIIASNAVVSNHSVELGSGSNIMCFAFISNQVQIGRGTLVNARANLHHNVTTGDFCEIGPGAILLGNVKLGYEVFVGAGTIILPGLQIGNNATIGAGAVVTKNVKAGITVKGNPAK